MKLSSVSSLQLFQLSRFGGFLLTGICFAKMGIPKEEISRFETFLWITGLCSFFWITGLMNSLLAIYPTESQERQKQLLFNAFLIVFLISTVLAAIILLLPLSERPSFYLLFNNPSFLIEFILFLHKRNKMLLAYGIVTAVLQVAFCVAPVYMGMGVGAAFTGLIVLAILKFSVALFLLYKYTSFRPDLKFAWEHLIIALPLMLSFLINSSAEYIDGAIVKAQFSLDNFSVFRYGSREFPLFAILAATLGTSLIPVIAGNGKEGLAELRRKSLQYMHWFFPAAIVLTLLARPVYCFVFSPQFEVSGKIFGALLLLTIPRLVFPQVVLTAYKRNRFILYTAIAEMAVNFVASLIFAFQFGLIGVAYGTVVAFVFEKMLLAFLLYKAEGVKPAEYLALKPFFIYAALLIVAFGVSMAI